MLQDPTHSIPGGAPLHMLLKIVDHVLSNNVFELMAACIVRFMAQR